MKSLKFIYNDDDFIESGESYNLKYAELADSRANYDKFLSETNDTAKWKYFKEIFLNITPKCPICEQQLNNYDDIDHYRPKSHYWWLAYDYKNYVITCDLCNRSFKKAKFPLFDESAKVDFSTKQNIDNEQPLLFNPLKDNAEELFQLNFKILLSGKSVILIEPLDSLDKTSYDYQKALRTIKVFELNNEKIISRFNLMNQNCSVLNNLVESRHRYLKNNTQFNKDLFFKSIKDVFGNMKNGLAVLVIKGQFKYYT